MYAELIAIVCQSYRESKGSEKPPCINPDENQYNTFKHVMSILSFHKKMTVKFYCAIFVWNVRKEVRKKNPAVYSV